MEKPNVNYQGIIQKLSIATIIALTSCNSNSYLDNSLKNESKNFKISAAINKNIEPVNQQQEYPTPSFDEIPNYDKSNIVPGLVNVIYRNEKKIRIHASKKKIKSLAIDADNSINDILTRYGVEQSIDGAEENEDDNILDEKERKLSADAKTEIPHLRSIHVYKFPVTADTIKISEELRKLPFVRTAYPVLKCSTSGFQQLSTQTASNVRYTGALPNDARFNDPLWTEEQSWIRFNRHKVFQAWNLYKSIVGGATIMATPKPLIAVIDNGFDTGFVGDDRPNYQAGFSVDSLNTTTTITDGLPTDPVEPPPNTDTISHGARMASLIGSPVNNSNGLSGILPGAPILPIKLKTINDATICNAIHRAANTTAKVINISLSLNNTAGKQIPISFSPTIAAQIYYATYSSNIPVVIAAGNDGVNLDDPNNRVLSGSTACTPYPACQDKGQIIVGGSQDNGLIWAKPDGRGSSYGQAITLTAYAGASRPNYASSYDTFSTNPSSTYTLIGKTGTSDSAAMTSAAIAMLKQVGTSIGYNYTAAQLRDLIAYTGTPLRATTGTASETKFLGKNLSNSAINTNRLVGMRDLNIYNAISLVYNASMFNTVTRIFNVDDSTQATVNSNWVTPYTTEVTGNDSFWGSNDYSSLNQLSFRTNNISGKGSFGYQVYRYGLLTKELLLGVSTVYPTWRSDYLTNPLYTTVGVTTTGYFPQATLYYTIP